MKFLYVMRSPSGRVRKVGVTNLPKVRCRRLRTRNHIDEVGDWEVEYAREYDDVEEIAHELLKAKKHELPSAKKKSREYFAVTLEEAQAAVDAAIDRASGIERVALLEKRVLDHEATIERLKRKIAALQKKPPA